MFYVVNQDVLVCFDYSEGQIRVSGLLEKVIDLLVKINYYWIKVMIVGFDGEFFYVGIGFNSNIGEWGMDVEEDCVMVWQIDVEIGWYKFYVIGLCNFIVFVIYLDMDQFWVVVNEWDELGFNLVLDYLILV